MVVWWFVYLFLNYFVDKDKIVELIFNFLLFILFYGFIRVIVFFFIFLVVFFVLLIFIILRYFYFYILLFNLIIIYVF